MTPRRDKHTDPWAWNHAWKKRVQRERRRLERDPSLATCWICGQPISMDLPPLHPRSFTLDHLVPLARGGDIRGEAKPAHRDCNASRGDGRRTKRSSEPTTILDW